MFAVTMIFLGYLFIIFGGYYLAFILWALAAAYILIKLCHGYSKSIEAYEREAAVSEAKKANARNIARPVAPTGSVVSYTPSYPQYHQVRVSVRVDQAGRYAAGENGVRLNALICRSCGSVDLVPLEGLWVCRSCGTKHILTGADQSYAIPCQVDMEVS